MKRLITVLLLGSALATSPNDTAEISREQLEQIIHYSVQKGKSYGTTIYAFSFMPEQKSTLCGLFEITYDYEDRHVMTGLSEEMQMLIAIHIEAQRMLDFENNETECTARWENVNGPFRSPFDVK